MYPETRNILWKRKLSTSPTRRVSKPRIKSPTSEAQPLDATSSVSETHIRVPKREFSRNFVAFEDGSPPFITTSKVDHENMRLYAIGSREDIKTSFLWSLDIENMTWEHVPLHHCIQNVGVDGEEDFPYRSGSSMEIFGPPEHRILLIFGGQNVYEQPTNDLFRIEMKSQLWTEVSITGGENIEPLIDPTIVLVDGTKLFMFGRVNGTGLNCFSLACYEESEEVWKWKIREKPLPHSLKGATGWFNVSPLCDGKRLLLMGWEAMGGTGCGASLDHLFLFDTHTYDLTKETIDVRKLPESVQESRVNAGLGINEIICLTNKGPRESLVQSVSVYNASPENKWRYLADFGPYKDFVIVMVLVLKGDLCALIHDERAGEDDEVANGFMWLGDVLEEENL